MTRVLPDGPFLEVPYALASAWTGSGCTWAQIETWIAFPPAVVARLTPANRKWAEVTVGLWPDFGAYQRETGRTGCPDGRAWLGPGDASVPIRLITGVMSRPLTVGGRWKW